MVQEASQSSCYLKYRRSGKHAARAPNPGIAERIGAQVWAVRALQSIYNKCDVQIPSFNRLRVHKAAQWHSNVQKTLNLETLTPARASSSKYVMRLSLGSTIDPHRKKWPHHYGYRSGTRWEFPKIGDPNIVPQIVGSLL